MADETSKTPEAPAAPAAKAPKRPPDAKENFRYIIRLANTDLEGARTVVYALTNIKGLGIRMAEVVTDLAGIPRSERIGNLTDEQVAKIQEVLTNLGETAPIWMVNRAHDWETGGGPHLFGPGG